jgi:hypothetical protein
MVVAGVHGREGELNVEILDGRLEERYEDFVRSFPGSLLYYSSRFKGLLVQLLGCAEEYLVAVERGTICGIWPLLYITRGSQRVYNSLPFYGSNGGPLATSRAASLSLVDAYNEIATSAGTLSSTMVANPFVTQDLSAVACNFNDRRIGQFTPLALEGDPWQVILGEAEASARRNVRKALRTGIEVERDDCALEVLRGIHQANMDAMGGKAKPESFFSLIPQYFDSGTDYRVYLAKMHGRVVAGLLAFYFNRTVEYYTPAVDHEYRSSQPLALLIITAMSDAADRGYQTWNWGGTWLSQTGVYRFKRKWAARETEYFYYTQVNELSILDLSREEISETFRGFYVVPFSALKQGG